MAEPAKLLDGPVVLFGRDKAGKPRAARFTPGQTELATKAAALMGMAVCQVDRPDLAELVEKLPVGRLHASGRGFVPYVRPELYDQVLEKAGIPDQPKDGNRKAREPNALPASWDQIAVGNLVIAPEGAAEGWWEAVVVSIDREMLTLRWRDYPDYPQVVRHRASVALLNPTMV